MPRDRERDREPRTEHQLRAMFDKHLEYLQEAVAMAFALCTVRFTNATAAHAICMYMHSPPGLIDMARAMRRAGFLENDVADDALASGRYTYHPSVRVSSGVINTVRFDADAMWPGFRTILRPLAP